MGEIVKIVGKEAFEQMDSLNSKLLESVKNVSSLVKEVEKFEKALSKADSFKETKTAMDNLGKSQNKVQQETEYLKDTLFATEEAYRKYGTALNQTQIAELKAIEATNKWAKELGKVAEATKQVTKEDEKFRYELDKERYSIESITKETARLRDEKKKLNLANAEGRRELKELNTAIDRNTKFVKENGDAAQKQSMNVGNYSGAFDGLSKTAGKAWGALRNIAYLVPGLGMAGIMGLAVDGVLALANSMGLLKTKTEEEIAQIKMFTDEQNKMISSIAGETSNLEVLYQTATNVNLSYYDRGEAVDELIKKYPDYFKNVDREKLLNGELQSTYESLTKSIYQRAEAQARQNLLTKKIEERIALEIKLQKMTAPSAKDEFYYSNEILSDIQAKLNSKNSEIKQLEDLIQLKKEDFSNESYYIDQSLKKKVEAHKKEQEYLAKHGAPTSSGSPKKSTTKSSGSTNEPKTYNHVGWDSVMNQLDFFGTNDSDEQVKKKANLLKEKVQKMLDENPAAVTIKFKFTKKENFDDLLQAITPVISAVNSVSQSVQQATNDITSTLAQAATAKADKEIKEIDRVEKAKLDSLSRITMTDKQRAEETKKIELEAEARRKAVEREKISRLRKYASVQKAADIAAITTGTALAVVNALQTKPAYVGIALAIAAGIQGAAQLAKAIATPLPQYKDGTDNHIGGGAIVGDGFEKELIQEPSGKTYWSGDKPTKINIPKGTKVTPLSKMRERMDNLALKYMAQSYGAVTTDTMQEAYINASNELLEEVKGLKKVMANKDTNITFMGDYGHISRVNKMFGNGLS